MLYIEFEALMGRHQTAKQLCYRAVSMLGGCKGRLLSFLHLYKIIIIVDNPVHHQPHHYAIQRQKYVHDR